MNTLDSAADATSPARQTASETQLEAGAAPSPSEDASNWFGFESVHPLTWVPPPAWGCGGVA